MADFLDFIDDDEEEEDVVKEEVNSLEHDTRSDNQQLSNTKESNNNNVKLLLDQRSPACGVLKFHNGIEESLILTVERDLSITNAEEVLAAVDKFCYSRHWMMHIGPEKGKILDNVVLNNAKNNLVCVELGSYCGYSAVRMASKFKYDDSILYCVECDPSCCNWTRRLCCKAGITSKVHVIEGDAESAIDMLSSNGVRIDVLFIDHDKSKYLTDLIRFEASGLLKPGAVVVADNILSFGVPLVEYLEHVRQTVEEGGLYKSSVLYRSTIEYSTTQEFVECGNELEDGIEISYLM